MSANVYLSLIWIYCLHMNNPNEKVFFYFGTDYVYSFKFHVPFSTGVFLLSWTPYVIVSFYLVLGEERWLHPVVSRSAAFFAKADVVWNPIILVVMIKDIRTELSRLFIRNEITGVTPIYLPRLTTNHMSATPTVNAASGAICNSKTVTTMVSTSQRNCVISELDTGEETVT